MADLFWWALLLAVIIGPLVVVRLMDRRRPPDRGSRDQSVDLRKRGGSALGYHAGGHKADHFVDVWPRMKEWRRTKR